MGTQGYQLRVGPSRQSWVPKFTPGSFLQPPLALGQQVLKMRAGWGGGAGGDSARGVSRSTDGTGNSRARGLAWAGRPHPAGT